MNMNYIDFLIPTQLVNVQLRGQMPLNIFVMKTDWEHRICTGYEFKVDHTKKEFSIELSHKYQFLIDMVVLVNEPTDLVHKLFPMPTKEEPTKTPVSEYKIDDKTKAFLVSIQEHYKKMAKEKMEEMQTMKKMTDEKMDNEELKKAYIESEKESEKELIESDDNATLLKESDDEVTAKVIDIDNWKKENVDDTNSETKD